MTEFEKDVYTGLSQPNKSIPSKYLYDEKGLEIFNKITKHPLYYLTRCEIEILDKARKELSALLSAKPFNLIDLGASEGIGIKTQILLDQFVMDRLPFHYIPIEGLDYLEGIKEIVKLSNQPNMVLFLGSRIGNFDDSEMQYFLHNLTKVLKKGDWVLIGFDLRKNTEILMQAYDDPDGLTRDFNLNLLKRINAECDANFNIENFLHYCTYNTYRHAMESYIVSKKKQIIKIDSLHKEFILDEACPIHIEYSHKYHLAQIEMLGKNNGLHYIKHYIDTQQYFVDTLFQVI